MNPIELGQEIEERYRRYLETSFYFKDPELRKSFNEALQSGHLSKGPYLEATPVFQTGQTPKNLFNNMLSFRPDDGFYNSILYKPLYQHQEEAIRKVHNGNNIIVATGTGSGKTEAFLYPILLHLYQELKNGTLDPGVRALILYPMNALANDQRDRLREICKSLKNEDSEFKFTFGQYIGETPRNENDSYRHARDQLAERQEGDYCITKDGEIVHGELIFRYEMQETPPHILLTNYSMLEYLLLRPDDSPLFDQGRARSWTFIVLDEAHQYRGSRGIEMAMLIRRLKRRLREGGSHLPFRCIATSATLVGENENKSDVAKFGSDLFDESFDAENVILGKIKTIPDLSSIQLSPDDYSEICEILGNHTSDANNQIGNIARKYGVKLQTRLNLNNTIGALMLHDTRAFELRKRINGHPFEVQQLADILFDNITPSESITALSNLVQILVQATLDPLSNIPLFSARYHLFLRSLEGAFVSYWPEKEIFLERKSGDETFQAFEIALCRECGQHYFVGQKNFRGGLGEAIRDPSNYKFGATFFRPINDERFDDENDALDYSKDSLYALCIQCGAIGRGDTRCGHENSIHVIKEESPRDEDRADQIARCGACGYHASGHDPVREVVHGTDGPHAVIAITLFQHLPENRKKILAFADSRQQAAFFAWYLEDSYREILNRNLIYKAIERLGSLVPNGLSLRELSKELHLSYRDNAIFPPSMGDIELRQMAWRGVYREFLTEKQRISLEGVGIVEWFINWPNWFDVPAILFEPPWSLSEDEAHDLIFTLLNFMRADRAVELQTEDRIALLWSDLNLQASQMRCKIGPPKKQRDVRSWDGKTGKRARFIEKVLRKKGISENEAISLAVETLRSIWEAIRTSDQNAPSQRDRLLIPVNDARRLNPDWWRVRVLSEHDPFFRCNVCNRVQFTSVQDVCQRHKCEGILEKDVVGNLPDGHYLNLYKVELPGALIVEEHTAQLDKDKARQFQKDFQNNRINVLSCSTTFELGVDLGDLDIIFLRNVPPEAFNYTQRVGRAGRRSGYPGFAITYCRRSPHDLYHFSEPERMLNGSIRPPVLSVKNTKIITRHITATVLSAFFREYPERFKTVESLFSNLRKPSAVSDFHQYLLSHRTELEETLRSIIPTSMLEVVGLDDGQWMSFISKSPEAEFPDEGESKFSLAESEISSDYNNVLLVEDESRKVRDYRTAEWARRRANTIANEDVLSFLSRKVVIPKYSFPVDVVELDTQRSRQSHEHFSIMLQRDLSIAISEFAPTSKLVANKKLWISYGIKKVAEKEWPRRLYKKCLKHNVFVQWKIADQEPITPCGCELPVFEYIIPRFGFTTNRDNAKEPTYRPARVFSTRPYFATFLGTSPGILSIPDSNPVVSIQKASLGQLTVLCEGRRGSGFYICRTCGAGFRKCPKNHRNPYGQQCNGMFEQVSLGHEFETDVLQLQFHTSPNIDQLDFGWFAYSLAYALVEGAAEVLEVPSTDLSTTVTHRRSFPIPPIILYDNVPGGAGLISRLEESDILLDCLEVAMKRVDGKCGCDEVTSCYGCLRSYRNQFAHQYLQRGPVREYLNSIVDRLRAWKD